MSTTTWVRVYENPLRPFMRALGLLWLAIPFVVLVGGLTRMGGLGAVLLGVVLVPLAGYAGYRVARVLWRVTSVGLFVSDIGSARSRSRTGWTSCAPKGRSVANSRYSADPHAER